MIQLTKKQAIEIAKSGKWKNWSDKEVFNFQIRQRRMCMDFSRFHEATEKVLGRPVWTHEFVNPEALMNEANGGKKPTMEEIIKMLPQDKTLLVIVNDNS